MSPVIRQNTNEQDKKVATNTPCAAGFNLCAERLQEQQWVSLTSLDSRLDFANTAEALQLTGTMRCAETCFLATY